MIRSTACRSCPEYWRQFGRSAASPASPWGSNPFSESDDVNRLWTRLGRAAPFVGVLIIVLSFALICLGLYGGDRYAHRRAEQQAAETLQPQLGTPGLPQVDIKGFPFLTQLVAGSIGTMHVVADEI